MEKKDKPIIIEYKNYTIEMLKTDLLGDEMTNCLVYKNTSLIKRFAASKDYTRENAIEHLKCLYKQDLEKKVLEILKPRIKMKSSLIEDKNVCFIETSGFVFKGSEEYDVLKEWLDL